MSEFPNRSLLNWYGIVKRDLPWRQTKNPYSIWVSEIILQQTRVDQGLPYYEQFTTDFPTVNDLANAKEDAVLKLWEGLGYYSRARNMHAAAKFVTEELNGVFPNSYEGLLNLKGVGPYTAAAIGSIAFDLPTACVDGNVIRVVARYFGIESPVDETPTKKLIAELAQRILSEAWPADHNQAMMELGATCCTPASPKCPGCPISEKCIANAKSLQKEIPAKTKKIKVKDRFFYYTVFTDGESTVLNKRPSGDIWQGLYEFPMIEMKAKTDELKILETLNLPSEYQVLSISKEYKHVLSHQRIYAKFVLIKTHKLNELATIEVSLKDLGNFALPRLLNRYLEQQELANTKEV